MKAVINYMRPQTGSQSSEIFGIDVAITQFLKAYFRYSQQEKFYFLPASDDSIDELKKIAEAEKIDFGRCAWLATISPAYTLGDVDVLFRPDPNMADHIWRRLQLNGAGYGVSSIVHTMSGERITGVLNDFLLAPSRRSDSLVCPSTAIRNAVKRLWEIQAEYYNHRFNTRFSCPINLPVIPLGIHTDRFANITTPALRGQQRAALGIADDEVVILYIGRLSYATKAHPLPLFQAAELAASRVKQKVRLVVYGFFMPALMEPEFRALAKDYCQNVQVDFVLNTDPRFPDGLWAAGDIFTSLIDNIQESFGLTPIEAMASGLPAVISNWDGYRDGVRHGVDGFHVPTLTVPEGDGLEIAKHYFNVRNYGDYLIRNNQAVAVDHEFAAAAFQLLIEDKERRLSMGQQGRTRASEFYDWRVIIQAYENLWKEQAAERLIEQKTSAPQNWHAVHPAFPDPSSMFHGFASAHIADTDKLELIAADDDLARVAHHNMNVFGRDMLLDDTVISIILGALHNHPNISVANLKLALLQNQPDLETPRFTRTVAWLVKMGLVRRTGS